MRMSDQRAIPNPNTASSNPRMPHALRARHTRQMRSSGFSHRIDDRRRHSRQRGG